MTVRLQGVAVGRDLKPLASIAEIELDNRPQFSGASAVPGTYRMELYLRAEGYPVACAYVGWFTLYEDGRCRSQSMEAEEWARQRGLPDLSLKLIRQFVDRPVFSSSNIRESWWSGPEIRTPAATKVWKRLGSGLVDYDPSADGYCLR